MKKIINDKDKIISQMLNGLQKANEDKVKINEELKIVYRKDLPIKGKVGLIFGSYQWADGEWMEIWQDRCKEDGINLVRDGLIAYDSPDDEALSECRKAALDLSKAIG